MSQVARTEDEPDLSGASTRAAETPPAGVRTRRRYVRPRWWLPILVFVWSQAILLLWWAGQFPGDLSYDSMTYVRHVTSGPWDQSHSVVYDSFVLLSLTLVHSVWLLTLAQTVVCSIAFAYFASVVRDWGVRAPWAALPAVVMPLLPSIGSFTTTVWKDVPFALSMVFLAATLLQLFRVWRIPPKTKKRSGKGSGNEDTDQQASAEQASAEHAPAEHAPAQQAPAQQAAAEVPEPPAVPAQRIPNRLLIAVLVEFLGLAFFRNNGAVMVLVITVVLAFVIRGLRLRIIALGAATIAAFVLATSVIYPAAGISRGNQQAATYVTLYGDIAVVYSKAPRTFTKSDKALMRKVAPLHLWRSSNNCYRSDDLYQGKGFNYKNAADLEPKMIRLWLRMLKRTPVAVIKTRLCRSSVAWNPFDASSKKGALFGTPLAVPSDLYGFGRFLSPHVMREMQQRPLSHGLARFLRSWNSHTSAEPWHALIWRAALWSYIAYLCLFVAARRVRNYRLLAVGVVCLANQLMVMLANPSQLYRYMAGPLFIGMLIVPIALARRPEPAGEAVEAKPAGAPDEVAAA